MRFGNRAFKTWLERVSAQADEQIAALYPHAEFVGAVKELKVYWEESFGHYERLDYGTGHELSFMVFIFCLFKLGIYTPDDMEAVVNKVFQQYLLLCRKIQTTYQLEPAGSHGVWGLDDY